MVYSTVQSRCSSAGVFDGTMYAAYGVEFQMSRVLNVVGRGGVLVESLPFDRRVAGSNSALAATQGPWASPSLAVACSTSAGKL